MKFRVGRIVYLAFSPDETVMGFGFPKEERRRSSDRTRSGSLMPKGGDLRYHWVLVRLETIDEGRDARARPRRVAHVRAETASPRPTTTFTSP